MKFDEVAKLYAAQKLRDEKIKFDNVYYVNFDVNVREGCPTCGPETEYECTIGYTLDGKNKYFDWHFYGLGDILTELFDFADKVGK